MLKSQMILFPNSAFLAYELVFKLHDLLTRFTSCQEVW